MARMKIFNESEQNAFESPPMFNSEERKKFFVQPLMFKELMESFKTPTNKICFLVTAGYFKARNRFFARQFHQKDIEFVALQMGINTNEINIDNYEKSTYHRHQLIIINYFGFSQFDSVAKSFIKKEISKMVKVQSRSKLILLEIIQILASKKIVIPTYNVLATLIVNSINANQSELNKIIKSNLTEIQKDKLDALLEKVTGDGSSDKWRYQATILKKPSQSTRPLKIKDNVNNLNELLDIYIQIKPVLSLLSLSQECLRHFAYSVIKSQIYQISRRASEIRYLHLISFIAYQTFRLQDILIDTLLLAVQSVRNAVNKEHKDCYYKEKNERDRSLQNLLGGIKRSFLDTISAIRIIIADVKLSADQKVLEINSVLNPSTSESNVENSIDDLQTDIAKIQNGLDYYTLLENQSIKLQNRVADIVRYTTFDENSGRSLLLEAILHYQKKSGNIDKNAPIEFLTLDQRSAIIDQDQKFRVSLYKALLYIAIADAIKSGVLNVVHSEKYRSLDDYLISKYDWENNKDEYLKRSQLSNVSDCKTLLQQLNQELDASYKETNSRFISGNNKFLTFRKNGTFHVSTPKLEETDSLSIGSMFPDKKYIPLIEVLATVDHLTGFLDEFEHWQMKYQQKRPQKKIFLAGIMAYGCDIGYRKLAQISKQINENELDNTLNWYFSLSNVQSANDRILQFMDRMDLPNIYRQQDDLLHTSSDGQKFEVAVDSLNANYSFKYLGKDKGVSVMSFIDMRQLMWYSTVISSAEREAAYVIDGLMHNDVIKSDIHSTDTHGYSEVIFAVTYLLGFTFAPRIRGLGRQQLYDFSNKNEITQNSQGFQPHKYINEELIEAQWDDVLRFNATIRLKVTTASQLFRRLNSYSKQHPLYKALKEFGKIPKTLFILKYVDDPEFRQSIEKQLNKVEGSHKLSKAISIGNDHAFLQGEKEDQDIAEGCRRLIKNAVICWNYTYLHREINSENNEERKKELIDGIRNGSVMRWSHFNFNGEFDFSDEKMIDSIGLEVPKNTPPKKI